MSDLIYPFSVLRIFPSLRCNFHCGYCSMRCQPELYKGDEYESEEVDVQKWIKALARVKPTRSNLTVVPCNAEPALYKGCAEIVNSIPKFTTMLYTNCSTESLTEIGKMKNRDNLFFYVSYHHGQIDRDEFVKNGKWLKENYNVVDFHAPAYPPWKDKLAEEKAKMDEAGIDLITDHAFLGIYGGEMNYSYLRGGKWIEDRFANRLKGTPKKKVWCKTSQDHASFYTRAYTVAPNGNIYTCWRYLYNHSDKGILGNFFDEDFQFKDEFFECDEYGDCNACTWHSTIIDRETGEKLDDDVVETSGDKISACMIVKDEEKNLARCLASIKDWVDEIIVVDTGSKDKTIEIAKSFGATVYEQEWQDDFSFHRNYSISKATGEWIFIIDADEEVPKEDGKAMRFMVDDWVKQDVMAVDVYDLHGEGNLAKAKHSMLRFFRKSLNPSYTGFVHNVPCIPANSVICRVPFRILHYGYNLDSEAMARKYERTVRMCKKATELTPERPIVWLQYMRTLKVKDGKFDSSKIPEMEAALTKGIDLSAGKNGWDNVLIQLLYTMSLVQYMKEDFKESVKFAELALTYKSDYLDAIYMAGLAYTFGVDANKGEEYILRYLQEQKDYDFSNKVDCLVMEHANDRALAYKALADIEEWRDKNSRVIPTVDKEEVQKIA